MNAQSYPVTLLEAGASMSPTELRMNLSMTVAIFDGGILPGQIVSEHIHIPIALASESLLPTWRPRYIIGQLNFTDLPARTHLHSDNDFLSLKATDVIYPPLSPEDPE